MAKFFKLVYAPLLGGNFLPPFSFARKMGQEET